MLQYRLGELHVSERFDGGWDVFTLDENVIPVSNTLVFLWSTSKYVVGRPPACLERLGVRDPFRELEVRRESPPTLNGSEDLSVGLVSLLALGFFASSTAFCS